MEKLVLRSSDGTQNEIELSEAVPQFVLYGPLAHDAIQLALGAKRRFSYLAPPRDQRALLVVSLLPGEFYALTRVADMVAVAAGGKLQFYDKQLKSTRSVEQPQFSCDYLLQMEGVGQKIALLYYEGQVHVYDPESNKIEQTLPGLYTFIRAWGDFLYTGTKNSLLQVFDAQFYRIAVVQLNIGQITSISITSSAVTCASLGGKSILLDSDLCIKQRKSTCYFYQFQGAQLHVYYPSVLFSAASGQWTQFNMSNNSALVQSAAEDDDGCVFCLNNMSIVICDNLSKPYILCTIQDNVVDITPRPVDQHNGKLGLDRLHAVFIGKSIVFGWKNYLFAQLTPRYQEYAGIAHKYAKRAEEGQEIPKGPGVRKRRYSGKRDSDGEES